MPIKSPTSEKEAPGIVSEENPSAVERSAEQPAEDAIPQSSTAGKEAGASPANAPSSEEAPASPPVTEPKPKSKDWRDDRIAKLSAQLKEARAKAPAQPQGTEPKPDVLPSVEIERRAQEIAAQQAQINAFNDACQRTANAGKSQFPDFDSRIKELSKLAGDGDLQQQMTYNTFIAAAIETGEAPKILHELGGNLDEAARIMSLPPFKMAVELTKMALGKPATETSKAPKPITPVGGQRASHSAISPDDPDRSDHLTTREWMSRRNEQVNKARERA